MVRNSEHQARASSNLQEDCRTSTQNHTESLLSSQTLLLLFGFPQSVPSVSLYRLLHPHNLPVTRAQDFYLCLSSDSPAQSLPHDLNPSHHHPAPGLPPPPVSCWSPHLLGGSLHIILQNARVSGPNTNLIMTSTA